MRARERGYYDKPWARTLVLNSKASTVVSGLTLFLIMNAAGTT